MRVDYYFNRLIGSLQKWLVICSHYGYKKILQNKIAPIAFVDNPIDKLHNALAEEQPILEITFVDPFILEKVKCSFAMR